MSLSPFALVDLNEKYEYVMISVRLASLQFPDMTKTFAIFSDTMNVIKVRLCMMVLCIKFYPFIPYKNSFVTYFTFRLNGWKFIGCVVAYNELNIIELC